MILIAASPELLGERVTLSHPLGLQSVARPLGPDQIERNFETRMQLGRTLHSDNPYRRNNRLRRQVVPWGVIAADGRARFQNVCIGFTQFGHKTELRR
jgi:hypothetical protein